MKIRFLIAVFLCAIGEAMAAEQLTIAFGSCLQQDRPQPIWEAVLAQKPDLFIFMGDNVYADTTTPTHIKAQYDVLAQQPGFQKLKASVPILATWDDHDYGHDDAGADYIAKSESQKIFLDFFEEPNDSPRRTQEGIYASKTFEVKGHWIQIILLDTRTFRSPLKRAVPPPLPPRGPYMPHSDEQGTLLGATQWSWLEERMKDPADIRIIVSSIQVLPMDHGWEKWGNFPHERKRLLGLAKGQKHVPVVFLSGDRHFAELSRLPGSPRVHEITASSMNTSIGSHVRERNRFRIGKPVREHNFGLLRMQWHKKRLQLTAKLLSKEGQIRLERSLLVN